MPKKRCGKIQLHVCMQTLELVCYRHLDMSEEGRTEGEEREMKGEREIEGELSLEEEYNLDKYSTSESEGEGD